MAALLPLSPKVLARMLDLFSGPGDLGRALHERLPSGCRSCET